MTHRIRGYAAYQFSAALSKVIAQPDMSERLTRWGLTVQFMPQAQLAGRERAYSQTWAQIIRKSGFLPQ
jgi:tripartite-type tricarboxylate transporter receptor subunit TctC